MFPNETNIFLFNKTTIICCEETSKLFVVKKLPESQQKSEEDI